ncbi:SDR family NAD(P)-dependent oxidoreductase [Novosphingobium malaysiense]|uniref:Short-chain dehydrogenase n=1 Tax=Novosphingobium malaysiense TaxID=1348853 RepID=A0A0B1ZIC1_9SPHN|nr:SDR family oxidoreductase [Novosphingobium malaysiense]KHK88951.1 hypothetical protein LK12_22900 [Novosphingobium malaysiense]
MKSDNIVIITGAASGMGAAVAKRMAGEGAALLLCDVRADALEAFAEGLPQDTSVECLAADISAEDLPGCMAAAIGDRRVSALIHCAGLSSTMADGDRIFAVNLTGTIRLVDAVERFMADGGCIVLFASLAAHYLGSQLDSTIAVSLHADKVHELSQFASTPDAAYSVSKRGVLLLARQKALALGRKGVRIVSLSPGVIDTPMSRAEMELHSMMRDMIEASPAGRMARAEEVAEVAAFLCSDRASFITGTDILVDGGAFSVAGEASV